MHYLHSKKTEVLNSSDAQGYLLAATEHNDFVELHIQSNGAVPAHTLPVDVSFYVVEGDGELTYNETTINAKPGDMIHINKHLQRSWYNKSKGLLKLLVIKQK
ncbi:MAG: cupin domain-containing protein [Carboxylicivirga sp.]|jgi:quercetin dioxygenase-like cupin family protein|nr:cupin domain-containing protein [Carboxylicivirga sp.]